MVTTQMKTDTQRFGNGKKGFNVKQVEEMLENAGGSYSSGDGIVIADDTISVDTTAIQEKLTAGAGIVITDDVISVATGNGCVYHESTDWTDVFEITNDYLIVKKNCYLIVYTSSTCKGMIYFAKGTYPGFDYVVPLYYIFNDKYLYQHRFVVIKMNATNFLTKSSSSETTFNYRETVFEYVSSRNCLAFSDTNVDYLFYKNNPSAIGGKIIYLYSEV